MSAREAAQNLRQAQHYAQLAAKQLPAGVAKNETFAALGRISNAAIAAEREADREP